MNTHSKLEHEHQLKNFLISRVSTLQWNNNQNVRLDREGGRLERERGLLFVMIFKSYVLLGLIWNDFRSNFIGLFSPVLYGVLRSGVIKCDRCKTGIYTKVRASSQVKLRCSNFSRIKTVWLQEDKRGKQLQKRGGATELVFGTLKIWPAID